MFEHADSAPLLIRLFQDEDAYVREEAIDTFGNMPPDVQASQVDILLKMAAGLKRPPMVVNQADPMNTTLIEITLLLFDNKGILEKNLNAVEKHSSKKQLYEAFRAMATLPSGGLRAWGGLGPTLKTHKSWPQVETVLKNYNDSKFKDEAIKALAAINNPKAKAASFITLE